VPKIRERQAPTPLRRLFFLPHGRRISLLAPHTAAIRIEEEEGGGRIGKGREEGRRNETHLFSM
jgi:hypothetical protein